MSNSRVLIHQLHSLGGTLSLEGERLRLIVPDTPEGRALAEKVRAHRGELLAALCGIPAHDPAAWAEDFHRWTLDRCCFRDRCFGGIGALHGDFCEHQMARNDVPCQRSIFEALLRNAGFLFADGLVSGLVLKTEHEAQSGKPAPAPGNLGEDGSLVVDPSEPDADLRSPLPGTSKQGKGRYRPLLTPPAKESVSA